MLTKIFSLSILFQDNSVCFFCLWTDVASDIYGIRTSVFSPFYLLVHLYVNFFFMYMCMYMYVCMWGIRRMCCLVFCYFFIVYLFIYYFYLFIYFNFFFLINSKYIVSGIVQDVFDFNVRLCYYVAVLFMRMNRTNS